MNNLFDSFKLSNIFQTTHSQANTKNSGEIKVSGNKGVSPWNITCGNVHVVSKVKVPSTTKAKQRALMLNIIGVGGTAQGVVPTKNPTTAKSQMMPAVKRVIATTRVPLSISYHFPVANCNSFVAQRIRSLPSLRLFL